MFLDALTDMLRGKPVQTTSAKYEEQWLYTFTLKRGSWALARKA